MDKQNSGVTIDDVFAVNGNRTLSDEKALAILESIKEFALLIKLLNVTGQETHK